MGTTAQKRAQRARKVKAGLKRVEEWVPARLVKRAREYLRGLREGK